MGISFTQFLLSCISFAVGYYTKARCEINQEALIKKLQMSVEEVEHKSEEELKALKYQLWNVEQTRDRLNSKFLELNEKIKTGAFESIPIVKVEKKLKKNVLNSFL